MKNKIIIISSPSGAGKTTICKKLIKKIINLKLSISYTTRPKRIGEVNSRDYYFINKKTFKQYEKNNFFIETAKVFDNLYGSPNENIKKIFKKNKNILFDIDWQGAKKIRKKFNHESIVDFFILPPSKKELEKRLIKRGRDNKSEIKKRLSLSMNEISHYNEYKYVLVNDSIERTVNDIIKIIKFEDFLDNINSKNNFSNTH